ncbi:MAG: transporter substrate-binding domain-containing protein [Alphaproteobacteria bacterium]|nr:MAG: transporter substrate-binding domain-containing protein [Alphaproteobacteria bacterium]
MGQHRLRVTRLLAGLLFVCLPLKAVAEDEVRLYFIAIDGLLSDDGHKGPLAEMLSEIGTRAGVHFDLKQLPVNRMIRTLVQEDAPAAGVPQMLDVVREKYPEDVRLSPPLIFRRDYVFVRKSRSIPDTPDQVAAMVIAKSPINSLPPNIRHRNDLTVIEARDMVSALRLLSRGRADAWISDETSTLELLAETGIDNVHYDRARPFYVWPAHIVYSAALDQLIAERIDNAILSAARDGTAHRLLPGNFVDDYDSYLSVEPEMVRQ